MELLNRHYGDRLRAWISPALSRFQNRGFRAGTSTESLRLIRAVALLMSSCVLAWISYAATRETTIIEYRDHHLPPEPLWRSVLEARGYHLITDPRERHHKLRQNAGNLDVLATQSSSNPVFHLGPGARILWFPRVTEAGVDQMWVRMEAVSASTTWTRLPYSLSGLEALSKLLESAPKPRIPAAKSRAKFVDPKEIRY
ncbi:hypothetical protein EBZ37_14555 [bacterium]|nr:hypothetical protein [bacterium]